MVGCWVTTSSCCCGFRVCLVVKDVGEGRWDACYHVTRAAYGSGEERVGLVRLSVAKYLQ